MKSPGNSEHAVQADTECHAMRDALDRVGDKWSVIVVKILGTGPVRFNELRRTVEGISQRVLTSTLRGLERDGLVKRTVYPTNPPQVDYRLTPLGRTLLDAVAALARWAKSHRVEVLQARKAFDRAQSA